RLVTRTNCPSVKGSFAVPTAMLFVHVNRTELPTRSTDPSDVAVKPFVLLISCASPPTTPAGDAVAAVTGQSDSWPPRGTDHISPAATGPWTCNARSTRADDGSRSFQTNGAMC